jgi:hypothetical protein
VAGLIGVVLALAIGIWATWVGLDRDRAFYPTVTIVIASYYALFAIMGGSGYTLLVETVVIIAFVAAAVAGFRHSLWIVVAALAAHGVLDVFHARLIDNPGVPVWWPMWCLGYDVMAAGYLAWLLKRRPIVAPAR